MNDKERDALELIVMYCDRAQRARDRHFVTKSAFDADTFYCDGIAQYIMQIGECVNCLSNEFINEHNEVPWHQIRGMRNIIAHAYGIVDADVVWDILNDDLPFLKAYCATVLEQSE